MARQFRKPPYHGTPMQYAEPSLQEARAIQAVDRGEATSEQQKLALRFIFRGPCRAGKEDLSPGQNDVTAYHSGQKSVMYQIGWVLGQPAEHFRSGEVD